jgi:cytohesin
MQRRQFLLTAVLTAAAPAGLFAAIKNSEAVEPTIENGITSLHEAAEKNNVKTIIALLKAGADVNAKGKTGDTPLHAAAFGNAAKAIDALIKAGADVNARDIFGKTPLECVLYANSYLADKNLAEAITLLLKAGADVDAKDIFDGSALYYAEVGEDISGGSANSTEAVAILRKAGAKHGFRQQKRSSRITKG